MTDPVVNVAELIDARPVGRAQVGIVILCGLIALLDGLDLQAIGLAAPAMTAALKISPQAFGAVFSAALAGLALGAFGLGPAADRIGRKRVLVASTLCFGVFTLCTAFVGSLNELLSYRFLTGIGLGGAMPSFISLTSEYAPKQHRATIVGLLWAGFPLGGVLGGLLASQLIPAYGWQSLFWVGGILPILLTILLFIALPESIGFLVSSGAPRERIVRILARVCPGWVLPAGARFTLGEEKAEAASIRELFSPGRSGGTALLWVSFFFTFMILVTNTAWAPTLLRGEGVAVAQSAFVMAIFNLGSVAGTSLAGYLVTRFGASAILPAAFIGATASLAMVGQSGPSIPLVILFQGLLGFCLGAGSSGLIALGALFYPTAIRSTGLGWAMGMGRFGSFVGPLMIGLLVGWQWPIATIFLVIGLPALLVAATAGLVGRQRGVRTADPKLATVPLVH